MVLTQRLIKGTELTYQEGDNNLIYLDKKLTLSAIAPTVTNDSSQGFTVDKNLWLDTSTGKFYDVTDVTVGSAVWSEISVGTAATGLEAINEGNGTGWRLFGADPVNYGNIGIRAIDLSSSLSASTTIGATGINSVAMGLDTTSSGLYSISMNRLSIASGAYSFASGLVTTAAEIGSVAMGAYSTAAGNYSVAIGRYVTASNESSCAFGAYNVGTNIDSIFEIGIGDSEFQLKNAVEIHKNGTMYLDSLVGTTANRPTMAKASSIPYLDTTLGIPIWWNGAAWVNATGTTV